MDTGRDWPHRLASPDTGSSSTALVTHFPEEGLSVRIPKVMKLNTNQRLHVKPIVGRELAGDAVGRGVPAQTSAQRTGIGPMLLRLSMLVSVWPMLCAASFVGRWVCCVLFHVQTTFNIFGAGMVMIGITCHHHHREKLSRKPKLFI